MISPTPAAVKKIRKQHNMTQDIAARLIHVNLRTWQQYEAGDRRMHPAFWELFLNKVGNIGAD